MPFLIVAGTALMALSSPNIALAAPLVTPEVAIPLSTSTVRAAVEREFGADSVMVRVAACESQYRQFGADGKPLPGAKDPDDTGVFQINKRFGHLGLAAKMGLDFNTLAGNIAFARYLYDANGTSDWLASRGCWE